MTYGSVTDIDGNAYKTIKIGTQTWMAENLKAEHFNDGSQIPNITAEAQWEFLTTEAYCDFNNKTSFSTIHGKLYNWYAVNNGKLCPAGWHIPSGVEWTTLIDFLGGQNTAGGKLKETGTTHWESPNEGATNQSGFTGIPGGWRSPEGFFNSFMNDGGLWWTSTEDSSDYLNAFDFYLYNVDTYILNASATKTCGFSVRCIMN